MHQIHPDDAAKRGIESGDQVLLYSERVPNFINTAQPSNALQGRVPDQISGNYNYKMGVARVKKIGESKYKSEFRSMSFAPRNVV
ncbi:MAG: hypothetical protein AB2535_17920 [Candidatus Thiodiazotropha endolucinida]